MGDLYLDMELTHQAETSYQQALVAAAIPFEVVPGISAYQAAAARLQVELTVPGLVQSIILTRISGRTAVPEAEELAALAAHRTSLCLYLSARHVEEVQQELLRHYPPETPVAIGYRVSWPDQWLTRVPLAEMAATSRARQLIRTTLYIVSPALAKPAEARSRLYSPSRPWLKSGRPLSSRSFIAAAQSRALARRLRFSKVSGPKAMSRGKT